jgi:uncharacterized membrane protein
LIAVLDLFYRVIHLFLDGIWFFFSGICHQLPAHSLHYQGQPLPLCARCTGTFVGALLAVIVLMAIGRGRRAGLPRRSVWGVLMGLLGLWALDGANSFWAGIAGEPLLYAPSNGLRLVSGLGAGLAIGVVLLPVTRQVLWGQPPHDAVVERPVQMLPLVGAAGVVALILLGWRDMPWAMPVLLVAVAVAVMFATVNMLLLVLLFRREGVARHPRRAWAWGLAGLVAGMGETGAIALVRYLLGLWYGVRI